ncbi:MAG: hypothetical protein DRG35_05525 [Deltaproteobacteria bacterium]|nr:MAG: hypothetical protein DRG35_05525 [Deltaproteobacteria bacterium]
MDIHQIDNLYQAKSLSSQKINKDNRFKQIFNQKLTDIDATASRTSLDFKRDAVNQSDRILHLLDDYARELTDPSKTLKAIEPLVESIKKEVNTIEAEAAEKVDNDNDLERIIKDLTITANVAISKFHRGDYV